MSLRQTEPGVHGSQGPLAFLTLCEGLSVGVGKNSNKPRHYEIRGWEFQVAGRQLSARHGKLLFSLAPPVSCLGGQKSVLHVLGT